MSADDLLGKVVSCESEEFLRILYPDFGTESEFDPFRSQPSIYVGIPTSKIVERMRSRKVPFIVFVKTGGEYNLTRAELFSRCTRRKRNYPEPLDEMPELEFINAMRILKVSDVLTIEEDESNVFELFELVAKKSRQSILRALDLADSVGSYRILYSLITFYQRVVSSDQGSVSPRYAMVIKRAQQNKEKYSTALSKLPLFGSYSGEMKILYLLNAVL